MYKLIISALAHDDLRNIISYIATTLCAPEAATRFSDEVKKCYGQLKNNPMIYALCNNARLNKEGYRRAVIKKYVLIYKVDEAEKIVKIYRLFYGAQDYVNKI